MLAISHLGAIFHSTSSLLSSIPSFQLHAFPSGFPIAFSTAHWLVGIWQDWKWRRDPHNLYTYTGFLKILWGNKIIHILWSDSVWFIPNSLIAVHNEAAIKEIEFKWLCECAQVLGTCINENCIAFPGITPEPVAMAIFEMPWKILKKGLKNETKLPSKSN